MAYEITDFNGTTIAPNGTYPYGQILDDGTVADAKSVGDMLQFFQRMMAGAGVTPNNLEENAVNGFQLYGALIATIPALAHPYVLVTNPASLGTIVISGSHKQFPIGIGTYEFDLSSSPTGTIESFGTAAAIGSTAYFHFIGTSAGYLNFVINSTNAGALPVIKIKGNTTPDSAYSPTDNTLMVKRYSTYWEIIELS
jgi:hypothetical protein